MHTHTHTGSPLSLSLRSFALQPSFQPFPPPRLLLLSPPQSILLLPDGVPTSSAILLHRSVLLLPRVQLPHKPDLNNARLPPHLFPAVLLPGNHLGDDAPVLEVPGAVRGRQEPVPHRRGDALRAHVDAEILV